MHGPPDWSITSAPAAGTPASATRALVVGQSHVCTSISASLGAVAAQGAVSLVLRDGATGVGVILWSMAVVLAINGFFSVALADLVIKGTAGNAMTLEFTGLAGTNVSSVALTGYDSA